MNAFPRKLVLGFIATAITAATTGVGQAKPIIHPYIYHPPVIYTGVMVRYPVSYVTFANPAPAADIRLINPAATGVTLAFRLNDGSARALPAGNIAQIRQQVVIEFDRGTGGGLARYSLTDGDYKFVAIDGRWDIVRVVARAPSTDLGMSNPPSSN